MATHEQIYAAPWLVNQRNAGNCGFVTVVVHMVRIRHPFLKTLLAYVHRLYPVIPFFAEISDAIERRRIFEFEKSEGKNEDELCDWYLLIALMLHFKRKCGKDIWDDCKTFTETLSPNWKYGQKLKHAISDFANPHIDETKAREIYQAVQEGYKNTAKSGTMAITFKAMIELLEVCSIKIASPASNWMIHCWNGVDLSNFSRLLFALVTLTPAEQTQKEEILQRWNDEFNAKFNSIPIHDGAIVGVKFLQRDFSQPDLIPKAAFHHWVYFYRAEAQKNEIWTWGKRYRINNSIDCLLETETAYLDAEGEPVAVYFIPVLCIHVS